MNIEALLIIGGGAVLLLAVLAPVAVWFGRRRTSAADAGSALSRTGLILLSLFVGLLVAGAVLAQSFDGLGRLAFAAGGLTVLIVVFVQTASVLERRGYHMFRASSDGSSHK